MDRWTIEELQNTDDITFAISILNQRLNNLNPFSPLSMKLNHAIKTLEMIKEEKDKYIARIAEATDDITDLSDAEPEIKTAIIANAKKLEEKEHGINS